MSSLGVASTMLSRRLLMALMIAIACLYFLRTDRVEATTTLEALPRQAMAVAVCVSGQARGDDATATFARTLLERVVQPSSAVFDVLIWLQDDATEARLRALLACPLRSTTSSSKGVRRCLTRRDALALRPPPPAGIFDDSATSIAAVHREASYGAGWLPDMSPNTLRMLHKLRGVEYLRRRLLEDGGVHAWVLRVRPDLALRRTLQIPPAGVATNVLVPWLCEEERLLSDQLLLLPGDATEAPSRLGGLYEPEALRAAVFRSDPPTMYVHLHHVDHITHTACA